MKFNQDGNAYLGEFFGPGGTRSGGFYDRSLEPTTPPAAALVVPPIVRVITQPCEACRSAAEEYNAVVAQMAPLQNTMARLAKENAGSSSGYQRGAIEQEFAALTKRWASLVPDLQRALAKLKGCQSACVNSSQTQSTGTPPLVTSRGVSEPAVAAQAGGVVAAADGRQTGVMTFDQLRASADPFDRAYVKTATGFLSGATPSAKFTRTTNADGSVTYTASNSSFTVLSNPNGGLSVRMPGGQVLPAAGDQAGVMTFDQLRTSTDPFDRAYVSTATGFLSGATPSARFMRTTNADGSVTYTASNTSFTVLPNPSGGLSVRTPGGQVLPAAGGQGGLDAAAKALFEPPVPAVGTNNRPAGVGNSTTATPPPSACIGSGCSTAWNACELTNSCEPLELDCGFPSNCQKVCTAGEICTNVVNLSECQGCNQIGGNNAGDRDETVQYMIVEIIILRAGNMSIPPTLARAAHTLWDTLRGVVTGARLPDAALTRQFRAGDTLRLEPFAQANQQGVGTGSNVQTLLTSLGTSTGEAFQIQVANDGKQPVNFSGNGIIVEPLKKAVAQRAQRAMSQLASRNPVTQKLDAYCVEMSRQPPSLGTLFRVASPEIQKKFAPMRRVLQASYRLQQASLLKPDSDPALYFSSIKQWALWSRERNFNQKTYADAFVDHTKKNVEAGGTRWTNDMEKVIRGLAPNRWADIGKILTAAEPRIAR